MNDYSYAAYFTGAEYVKADHNAAYAFGTGDFSTTMLFSAYKPGIILSCFTKSSDKEATCGWYIELKSDNTIYFYTGDGEKFCVVQSEIIPDLLKGYIFCLAAIRQNGKLSLVLDEDELELTKSGTDGACNVTADADIVFGGCVAGMKMDNFSGSLQNVTLWNRAIAGVDLDFAFNDIIFEDDPSTVGWWNFNLNLKDQSRVKNSISYSDGLAFVPFYDVLGSEGSGGFVYQSLTMNSPYAEKGEKKAVGDKTNRILCAPMTEQKKLIRNICFEIDGNGALIGSCNERSYDIAFPEGVEVTLTSPDGISAKDMKCSSDVLIVLDKGRLFQFLIINPKHGKWTLSVCAPADRDFLFDCQFVPEGTKREELVQTINAVYPNREDNPGRERSEYFLFSTMSRIIVKQLETQTATQNAPLNDGRTPLALLALTPLILVEFATAVIAVGTIIWEAVDRLFLRDRKTITVDADDKAQYENPLCDWSTTARYISNEFTYSEHLLKLYNDIAKVFNCQTPTDPKKYYKQSDLNRIGCRYVHIDLGGEGRFVDNDMWSGFANAININAQTHNSQMKNLKIPFLIPVKDWDENFVIPFEDGTVDRITAQSTAPFTDKEREEIARTIRKKDGSSVDVWASEESINDFNLKGIGQLIKDKYGLPKQYTVKVVNKAKDDEFDYSDFGFYKYSLKIVNTGGEL